MTLQTHPSTTAALVEEIEALDERMKHIPWHGDEAERVDSAILSRQYELLQSCTRALGCDVGRVVRALGGNI